MTEQANSCKLSKSAGAERTISCWLLSTDCSTTVIIHVWSTAAISLRCKCKENKHLDGFLNAVRFISAETTLEVTLIGYFYCRASPNLGFLPFIGWKELRTSLNTFLLQLKCM